MSETKKGLFSNRMVQLTVNVPSWVLEDLARLSEADGLSMNTFSRKWVIDALNKEKHKRGWV